MSATPDLGTKTKPTYHNNLILVQLDLVKIFLLTDGKLVTILANSHAILMCKNLGFLS
jgi:hypothetical protein